VSLASFGCYCFVTYPASAAIQTTPPQVGILLCYLENIDDRLGEEVIAGEHRVCNNFDTALRVCRKPGVYNVFTVYTCAQMAAAREWIMQGQ
jgi:hypothetical protein